MTILYMKAWEWRNVADESPNYLLVKTEQLEAASADNSKPDSVIPQA